MKQAFGGLALVVLLIACGGPESSPKVTARQSQQDESKPQTSKDSTKSPLEHPCQRAFTLIEANDPGEAKRKEAVAIANQAYFIDDSPRVNAAFSNLNNVYVYDDGSSSEEEVRHELNAVCE
jgi:hypothetical protein